MFAAFAFLLFASRNPIIRTARIPNANMMMMMLTPNVGDTEGGSAYVMCSTHISKLHWSDGDCAVLSLRIRCHTHFELIFEPTSKDFLATDSAERLTVRIV